MADRVRRRSNLLRVGLLLLLFAVGLGVVFASAFNGKVGNPSLGLALLIDGSRLLVWVALVLIVLGLYRNARFKRLEKLDAQQGAGEKVSPQP